MTGHRHSGPMQYNTGPQSHPDRLSHALHFISNLAHDTLGHAHSNENSTNHHNRIYPAFDLEELEHTYEIYGDLPGVQRNDVKISIISDTAVEISGSIRCHSSTPGSSKSDELTPGNDMGDPFVKVVPSQHQHGEHEAIDKSLSETDATMDGGPCKKTHHADNIFKDPVEAAIEGQGREQETPQVENHQHETKVEYKTKHIITERRSGDFHRVFQFSNSIVRDSVDAKFDAGVLHVTVKKGPMVEAKDVLIDWASPVVC